ncbi:MAG: hypothetical protein SGJ17_06500 [Hyphomicrobiales bacterium]|nr:hypothetical protein [Hyphomicrobiales bacterium]
MAGHALVEISTRSLKHPIPVQNTRPHSVFGLLAVFLALMLGDAGEKMLDQLRVGIVAKLDGRGFENPTGFGDGRPEFEMRRDTARQARHIVDNNDRAAAPAALQEREHCLHSRTLGQFAGHIVLEGLQYGVVFALGKLASAGFLRVKAVALTNLFCV